MVAGEFHNLSVQFESGDRNNLNYKVMEEVEDVERKELKVFRASNTRLLIKEINERKIPKEDVVTIVWEEGTYIIFYYN